jgi:hypothetical protein
VHLAAERQRDAVSNQFALERNAPGTDVRVARAIPHVPHWNAGIPAFITRSEPEIRCGHGAHDSARGKRWPLPGRLEGVPTPKTPAQLDAEIAEALATGAGLEKKLTAKRAKGFRDSGNYELRDEAGVLVALMFRDPENREWYEEYLPGVPQIHFVARWRGGTQAEAIANITKRRRR